MELNRRIASSVLATGVAMPSVHAADVVVVPFPGDSTRTIVVHRADLPVGWDDAHRLIEIVGGDWCVPLDADLRTVVADATVMLGPWECVGPWIGVLRAGSRSPIAQGWIAMNSGREIAAPSWSDDAPVGASALRWAVALDGRDDRFETWIELQPDADAGPGSFGLVATMPADAPDCDADGIPDAIEVHWLGSPPCDLNCIGDLDGSGEVDGADLGAWLVTVGAECPQGQPCPGDLDGDGEVTGADLGRLLAAWGPCD
ncbi:MAG: hypothetical protein RLZZ461_465 [Planctomycetota bacterium]|jgi:hypothetical protein